MEYLSEKQVTSSTKNEIDMNKCITKTNSEDIGLPEMPAVKSEIQRFKKAIDHDMSQYESMVQATATEKHKIGTHNFPRRLLILYKLY